MKLEAYLKTYNCSVEDLATKAGISVPAVYKYLQGNRTPSRAILPRIVEATNGLVTPNDFYNIKHPPPDPAGQVSETNEGTF